MGSGWNKGDCAEGTRPADLVFVPTSACGGFRGGKVAGCHYSPSPGSEGIWPPGEAGLTSKPHRDRSTRSRLTWAVSPAAGIGLPERGRRVDLSSGATTDPGGCHVETLAPL